jgi:hypothetical protein
MAGIPLGYIMCMMEVTCGTGIDMHVSCTAAFIPLFAPQRWGIVFVSRSISDSVHCSRDTYASRSSEQNHRIDGDALSVMRRHA